MQNNIVNSEKAPKPIGPYSQAVWSGNTLYLSGQIAINPDNNELVSESISSEAHQIMKNIQAVLSEANLDLSNVIKASIF